MYTIYMLDLLRTYHVRKSYEKFEEKDEAILYCQRANNIESEIDSGWFHFYIKPKSCFDEFPKDDEIIEAVKTQIEVRLRSIANEKIILDKANKILSKMEEEAV